jgi:ABC-type microcin C transport system permease subunit YejB
MISDDHELMSAGARFVDRMKHFVLPALTLTYAQLAIFARFSKSAVTEVIRQDFITVARAKGAGRARVMWRHAFRNALLPLITLLGLTISYLLSGSVIVERIFPVGRHRPAVLQRDPRARLPGRDGADGRDGGAHAVGERRCRRAHASRIRACGWGGRSERRVGG